MVKTEFKAVTTSCQNRDSLENKLKDTTGGMGEWGERVPALLRCVSAAQFHTGPFVSLGALQPDHAPFFQLK